MSDKTAKKTEDGTRNSQNCICDAYTYFCRAALEAKRDCSQKLLFEGGMERRNSEPKGQGSDKSEQKWQTRLLWRRFGGQKRDLFNAKCSKSVCKIMLPTVAKSTFLKKTEKQRTWVTSDTKIVLDPTLSPPRPLCKNKCMRHTCNFMNFVCRLLFSLSFYRSLHPLLFIFGCFFENMLPALGGKHDFESCTHTKPWTKTLLGLESDRTGA